MSGKKGMKIPRYSEEMKQELKQMVADGKTQREIAEYFGLKDRMVVHQILKRERKKEREQQSVPVRKGRPQRHPPKTVQALEAENRRLRMENELMRSFLEVLGRK